VHGIDTGHDKGEITIPENASRQCTNIAATPKLMTYLHQRLTLAESQEGRDTLTGKVRQRRVISDLRQVAIQVGAALDALGCTRVWT